MKIMRQAPLCILWILVIMVMVKAQSAILKQDANTGQYYIDVSIGSPLRGTPAALNIEFVKIVPPQQRLLIQKAEIIPTTDGVETMLRLDLDNQPEAHAKYKLAVFAAGIRWLDLDVGLFLTAEFFTEPGHQCPGAIAMRLSGGPHPDLQDAAQEFWRPIFVYLYDGEPSKLARIDISSGGNLQIIKLNSISTRHTVKGASRAGRMDICLEPSSKLPTEKFNIKVTFIKETPPLALTEPFIGSGLDGAGSPSLVNAAAPPGKPGARQLERNLDLGISYTRSPETKKNEVTGKDERVIGHHGVLDLRLAPWLNYRGSVIPSDNQKWFFFWTPFYLDANVATGKIVKETASLNRIELGTQIEFRYIPFKKVETSLDVEASEQSSETETGHYTTFHRFILSGKHVSDRDFKQDEFTSSFEFQPIFAALNHPLRARWRREKDTITDKPVFKFSNFGWEFKPKMGFEIGKTYHRRDPAEVITPSPTVRRGFFGIDIILDLTSHVMLTASDTFYFRGELREDRQKNYFKSEIDVLLGRLFGESIQGLFITFERGNKPPFDVPDVNAVRIGYRIRSQGWFGLRR